MTTVAIPLPASRHEASPPPSAEKPLFVPRPPADFREAGLNAALVETLVLKYLLSVGTASGGAIAKELCLPNAPVLALLADLKQQQVIGYVGAAGVGDFNYVLTDLGRDRARRGLQESRYVGPAPVRIDHYLAAVAAQTIADVHPATDDLRAAFADLLINKRLFAALGPAINSGRAMFLYGPAGNGKSSIAERITRCFGDTVYIPRVVHVDGVIVKLFDPVVHEAVAATESGLFRSTEIDSRWVRIARPTVVVGGEMTLDMLEVGYNPTTGICEAPLQMKSNLGTFVIDDFGRQRMRPIELLNRWIVPLEKRVDFLTLPNGCKIRIPFDQLIIFATNLEPEKLVDEAFLRRIPYKIRVPDPEEAEFLRLFELAGDRLGFPPNPQGVERFLDVCYRRAGRPFRFCQPRDLLMQIRDRCLFEGRSLEVTPEALETAAAGYFTTV